MPQELPTKSHTTAQVVLSSGMLCPPSTADAHPLPISPSTPLLVVEEHTPEWAIMYCGTIASVETMEDLAVLEDTPVWLLKYLLLGRMPQVAIVKIQFVLLPGENSLPELVSPSLWLTWVARVRLCSAKEQNKNLNTHMRDSDGKIYIYIYILRSQDSDTRRALSIEEGRVMEHSIM